MTDSGTLHHDRRYFEAQYRGDDDPWGFDDSPYEMRKYALTVASLRKPRYRRAFEPGCANGALTARLADRCDALVASELLDAPARRAAHRLRDLDHVEVVHGSFPRHWPDGTGDLLVLSEIAYYLTPAGRTVAERGMAEFLENGADVLAVHYTLPTDYPMQGEDVGEWLDGLDWLERLVVHHDESFELGVWVRRR